MEFSDKNVKSITNTMLDGKAERLIADDGQPGLLIRLRQDRKPSYCVRYSFGGKDRRIGIGKVGKITLTEARKKARGYFNNVSDKVDPLVERAKATVASGISMVSLFDPFEAHLHSKRRSEDYINRTLDYLKGTEASPYFRPLHIIPLGQINRATVARELSKIESHNGPVAMSRARAALSRFVTFCYTQGHQFANPVQGTIKYDSDTRDRVLQPEELKVIWHTAGDDDYGQIVKLLMLTSARRTQIGSLKRAELFLDASETPMQDRLVAFPGQGKRISRKGGSKNNETFYMPLPRQALAILRGRKSRKDNDHVFGEGKGGFSGWSACKARHEERIGDAITEQWGFHDFRRSFETLGQDILDLDGALLDACQNHKTKKDGSSGARRHYDFAKLLRKRREAHQAWADWIENLVSEMPKLKVVSAA